MCLQHFLKAIKTNNGIQRLIPALVALYRRMFVERIVLWWSCIPHDPLQLTTELPALLAYYTWTLTSQFSPDISAGYIYKKS